MVKVPSTNVSGRSWKGVHTPTSRCNVTKESKTSFAKRREAQAKDAQVKKLSDEIKDEAKRVKEQQRKQAEAAKKKKEENLLKSVKVQVVKDVRKVCNKRRRSM